VTDASDPAALGLTARRLDSGDIGTCVGRSAAAGWNQRAEDWALMLEIGAGFGLFKDGAAVGTALALPHATAPGGSLRIGWISMVIVSPEWQRRGLASWLVRRCIAFLEEQGVMPMLDATPAGREVYLRLGFRDGVTLTRLEAQTEALPPVPPVPLRPATPADLTAIAALDAAAFGADRTAILAHLLARAPAQAFVLEGAGGPAGFVLGRSGRRARQVGPLVADDEARALALLRAALAAWGPGPVFIDLADAQTGLRRWLDRTGFAVQRPLLRMHRGLRLPRANAAAYCAAAGPELG